MKTNMKKLLAATALTLLSTGAFAQTSPGTVVVTGSLHLNGHTSESKQNDTISHKSHGTAFRIGPSIGYVLGNNFELGSALGYFHSTITNKGFNSAGDSYETKEKSNAFSITSYLKKYIMLSEQFTFTGQLSAGLAFHKRNTDANTDYQPKSTFFNAALAPGLTYFPSDKLGVSAGLGGLRYEQTLKKSKAEDTPVKTLSGFSINFKDALYFSLSYYINR